MCLEGTGWMVELAGGMMLLFVEEVAEVCSNIMSKIAKVC